MRQVAREQLEQQEERKVAAGAGKKAQKGALCGGGCAGRLPCRGGRGLLRCRAAGGTGSGGSLLGHQRVHAYAENSRQPEQVFGAGGACPRLPLGNGLPAHADKLRHLLLRQPGLLAALPDAFRKSHHVSPPQTA